ncbi:MAG: MarC family protein [Victivallales bacterium]
MANLLNLAFQFFVILTPFALLSAFLAMTQDSSAAERRRVALKTGISVVVVCIIWFFFGNFIFMLFGVKIDAFRIGGGTILFLNAILMVRGNGNGNGSAKVIEGKETSRDYDDIAVVPLAIPITVGPGTTAALIVMGNEYTNWKQMCLNLSSLLLAIAVLTTLLLLGTRLEQLLTKKGITIVSKVSGLFLSAIAAQMIFDGIKNILFS